MASNNMVALLRGINVGGHKKFPKADQIEMLNKLGFKDCEVYLHTGNWVFSLPENSALEKSATEVSKEIETAILHKYGWDVPVLVKTAEDVVQAFNECPFQGTKKEKSYFVFLKTVASQENKAALHKYSYPDEEFRYTDSCIYFYPALGAGRAKMNTNFFENKLNVTATARNYNTMKKLVTMVE